MNNETLLLIVTGGVKYRYFNKRTFLLNLFSFIAEDSYEDDFMVLKDKSLYLKLEDDLHLLTDKYTDKLLNFTTKVQLPKGTLLNCDKNIETTIGLIVSNFVLLVNSFGNKVPYINRPFDVKEIENTYIAPTLTDDLNDLVNINIKEMKYFFKAVTYIEGLTKYLSVAATYKSMVAPAGIKEFKAKVIADMVKEHGDEWYNDPKLTSQVEDKLSAFDKEWLKGDISEGRLMHGKTMLARKKMYLNVGMANTFNGNVAGTSNSLLEGWGKDPATLATLYNDARSGSYYRGVETQDGGVMAKILLRATNDVNLVKTDCYSKLGIKMIITKTQINRYVIVNDKAVLLTSDNIDKYDGKEMMMRSPMHCNMHKDFCIKCSGVGMTDYEKGVSLLSIDTAGEVLKASLKKFHASALELTNVTLKDFM